MIATPPPSLAQRIGMHALHGIAWVTLRLSSPMRAARIVRRVGNWLPALKRADARAALSRLGARGTCLTRSLAVAARVPGAKVVIGVARPGTGSVTSSPASSMAHAWVEVEDEPLRASDPAGTVIVTL